MSDFKRILVAVDFSKISEAVFKQAGLLGSTANAVVHHAKCAVFVVRE